MRSAASSTDCALRWRSSSSVCLCASKASSSLLALGQRCRRGTARARRTGSPVPPAAPAAATAVRRHFSGVVARPSALVIAWPNSVNCAANWATASAEPSDLRRWSARARGLVEPRVQRRRCAPRRGCARWRRRPSGPAISSRQHVEVGGHRLRAAGQLLGELRRRSSAFCAVRVERLRRSPQRRERLRRRPGTRRWRHRCARAGLPARRPSRRSAAVSM